MLLPKGTPYGADGRWDLVMFATCITIVLVPSLYVFLEDIKKRFFTDQSAA